MAKFGVRELHPEFGSEVEGLDLRADLDAETVEDLRRLFDDRGVVLLRDVELAAEDQAYVMGLVVGREPPADRATAIDRTHVYANYVTNRDADGYAPFGELLFHCDMMWADTPVEAISLYGVRVVPPTVPTRFASMAFAEKTLQSELRRRLDGLRAVHVTGQQRRGDHKQELVEIQHETPRSTTKPVLWKHPRTGQSLLYVSQQMTGWIEGLDPNESEALLEELFSHLYRPEVVFEHEWAEGDLVVWDNSSVQHARGNVEFEGPERTLRKVIAPKSDLRMSRPTMVRARSA
jgi:taurine dioxygenase